MGMDVEIESERVSANIMTGWDSCFEYEGKTYAEMDKSAKNAISHRGKALEKLKEWLKEAKKVDA
jgi:inosine triphosphate pyrophosphatase